MISPKEKNLLSALLLVSIVSSAFFYNIEAFNKDLSQDVAKQNELQAQVAQKIHDLKLAQKKAFENLSISSKGAIIYDFKAGKALFDKNADVALPLASITKIATAGAYLDSSQTEIIEISQAATETAGDANILPFEKWSVKEAVEFMITGSVNDLASALKYDYESFSGGKSFIDAMNDYAKKRGLSTVHFLNETGLDIENKASGYGSSRDVAILLKNFSDENPTISKNTVVPVIYYSSINGIDHQIKHTFSDGVGDTDLVLAKTGFTDIANGNLATIYNIDGNVYGIVSLGSNLVERSNDIFKLKQALENYITLINEINS